MARATTTELQLLHAVRIRATASTNAVAAMTAGDALDVRVRLERMHRDEELLEQVGTELRWSLSEAGMRRHVELMFDDLTSRQRQRIAAAHGAFEPLDALFSDLQPTRPSARRRRSAAGTTESRVHTPLGELHERVVPLAEVLAGTAARFVPYLGRLLRAEHRIVGDFSGNDAVEPEPYDRVWVDLRIDLALTLDHAEPSRHPRRG